MAYIQVSLMSLSLMRTVPVTVILPTDKMPFPGAPAREPGKPYKTLYLLHGIFGSSVDWVTGTRIQRYAEENDLAVVMPSGDNMFYVDQPVTGNNYGQFIGQELVEATRKMFPLSTKREDTFIGGLSMGGYGALRNGLKYSETFGSIVALSSALNVETALNLTNDAPIFMMRRDYMEACFGDLEAAQNSDVNPKWLIRQCKEQKKPIPNIYMAIGDEDSLLGVNEDFAAFLRQENVPITFEVRPGNHEWEQHGDQQRKCGDMMIRPATKSDASRQSGTPGTLCRSFLPGNRCGKRSYKSFF